MAEAHIPDEAAEAMVTQLLLAARLLVAITARSLAHVEAAQKLTMPQFRTLVCLYSSGPMSISDMASELGVNPSTAQRMANKLSDMHLLTREVIGKQHNIVRLRLSDQGNAIVTDVHRRRKNEIAAIVKEMPDGQYQALIEALESFSRAGNVSPPSFLPAL